MQEAKETVGTANHDICPTISSNSFQENNHVFQKEATKGNSQGARIYETSGISTCLSSGGGGLGAKTGLYDVDSKIRRLTEIECERLQGFPDDWTKYGFYGDELKLISKTQRYKMLGNAVSVPAVKAVASRLKQNFK